MNINFTGGATPDLTQRAQRAQSFAKVYDLAGQVSLDFSWSNPHRFVVHYPRMNLFIIFFSVLLQGYSLISPTPFLVKNEWSYADSVVQVPVGGNTWADNTKGRSRLITNEGIENWTDAATGFTTYIRISKAGNIRIYKWCRPASYTSGNFVHRSLHCQTLLYKRRRLF